MILSLSHPSRKLLGSVNLPASKSIANRLLMLRAVAGFEDVEIENLSNARDTVILDRLLQGYRTSQVIDVQDAGTVMRFMTAFLAASEGSWTITGTDRMKQRPIGPLVDVLRQIGADISYEGVEGFPPLNIRGKQLAGGRVYIDASISSQFISALLMIAPLCDRPLELVMKGSAVSTPYIDMTIGLMKNWGAHVTWEGGTIRVANKPYARPKEPVFVESDWSAASYFYSMLALAESGELRLPYLFSASLQGDSRCAEIFSQFGITTEYLNDSVLLKKAGARTLSFQQDFLTCPDISQTVAVYCAAAGVQGNLTGLRTLAIKETDRINALKTELAKVGVAISSDADSISIPSHGNPDVISNPLFETYHDHRMAMSFACLALINPIRINEPEVVAKSFPHFWEEFKKLGFQVTEV